MRSEFDGVDGVHVEHRRMQGARDEPVGPRQVRQPRFGHLCEVVRCRQERRAGLLPSLDTALRHLVPSDISCSCSAGRPRIQAGSVAPASQRVR
jgi:hypothetical protein